VLSTIGITVEIYLFFVLMGWGATRLILPESTRPYQFWIAPWFGLIVCDISVVWLSRLGRATDQSVYLVFLLGIGLLVLCKFRKVPLSIPLQRLDGILAIGSLVALFLALSPLFAVNHTPTTISLGNGDPILYAITADFLRSHNINQPPPFDADHVATFPVIESLAPGHRTGSWLVIALVASQFNLRAYKIFTLLLGVFFALTPALITISTWIVTKRRFAAAIALTLSVLNVNLLFFNYHGHAGQVFAQGCLILAFLLLYLAERGEEPYKNYLLPLGLSISSLFTIYPEMGIFFIVPFAFYVALKLIHIIHKKSVQKVNTIKNLALVLTIAILIEPLSFWNGIKFVFSASQKPAGWEMPRWAFPVDMVGLSSIHSSETYSIIFLVVASLLVVGLIACGLYSLDNKTLGISILTFALAVLLWFRVVRGFSYGYYKVIGYLTFAIIIAFAGGLAWIISRYSSPRFSKGWLQFITLCSVGLFSAMAVWPTSQTMISNHLRVTPELANLSEVAVIAKKRKVYLDTPSPWEQFWASNFLQESRISFYHLDPYYYQPIRYDSSSAVEKGGLLLTRNWDGRFMTTDKLLWNNNTYSLIAVGENTKTIGENNISKLRAKLGKNWWNREKWLGEQSNSEGFQWMNQDGTIEIENSWNQPLKAALKLKFIPILPKTTVDVYLNSTLIKTIEVKKELNIYLIDCQLKPGSNQLLFHVREGTFQPPKDSRTIALGLLGETKDIFGENTISVQLGKNWWYLEKWFGEPSSDSSGFRWMNQNGTLEIENNSFQPLQTSLKFKFLSPTPKTKTTVDVYLNNGLIKTIEVEDFKFYSVDCRLKPGDNEVLLHVREGSSKPSGDRREIAIGVNAIRIGDEF
jgi:sRNA-binding regulator protein Hfq